MFNFFNNNNKKNSIKPLVLIVLDGFGSAPASSGNAITSSKTPNLDRFKKLYPYSELIASGESVGLPANEVGNSEVGHLAIGAGRVIFQSLKRINRSINDASFFTNDALLATVGNVIKSGGMLHIMGLASTGNVHASLEHLWALLELAKKNRIEKVRLHLFTDGRDAPPQEAAKIITEVEDHLEKLSIGKIATVAGRYWAMDRDKRWERTQKVYDAITGGIGVSAESAVDAIKASYGKGINDEFIEPIVIIKNNQPIGTISEGDSVIFFNFRIDRPRQLTMAFTMPDFENLKSFKLDLEPDQGSTTAVETIDSTFVRKKVFRNVFFTTMTQYQRNIPVSAVAFPPTVVTSTLPEIIAGAGLFQMHMAESEKERMVTYYFDGLRESPFFGEEFLTVPSPKVATYDAKPEMSLPTLVDRCIGVIAKNKYKFIVVNFANCDMVAHSGKMKETQKAVECVDKYLGKLVKTILDWDGSAMITADHGNAEELITFPSGSYFFTAETGDTNTDHSNNPVPVFLVNRAFEGRLDMLSKGTLSDVAPTILTLLTLPIPTIMTGKSLLR